MQIGMMGLGRMGANIVRRLMKKGGHQAVVYDKDTRPSPRLPQRELQARVICKTSSRSSKSRAPSGSCCPPGRLRNPPSIRSPDCSIEMTSSSMAAIPSGKDDIRRAKTLRDKGIHYVDVGTSGGVWGLERGYCMMIGGDKAVVDRLDPIFASLAPGRGDIPRNAEPRRPRSARRAGIPPRGARRRRPFRQDGS